MILRCLEDWNPVLLLHLLGHLTEVVRHLKKPNDVIAGQT
jgi:hypothetical protein